MFRKFTMSSQLEVSTALHHHQTSNSGRQIRSVSVIHGFSQSTHKSQARRDHEYLPFAPRRRSEQLGSESGSSSRQKSGRRVSQLSSEPSRKKLRRGGSCDSLVSLYSDSALFSDSNDVISLHGSEKRQSHEQNSVVSTSDTEYDSSTTTFSSETLSSSEDKRRRHKRSKKKHSVRSKKLKHKKSKKSKKSKACIKDSKQYFRSPPTQVKKTIERTTPPIHTALDLENAYGEEWKAVTHYGIERELYKKLCDDYNPEIHLRCLVPPKIDEELAPHLSALTMRRDQGLATTQKSSARALIATGAALTILTNHIKREENMGHSLAMSPSQCSDLHGFLWDATSLLTAGFYGTSKTRRNLLAYSLKPQFRSQARTAPLNERLFGGQIPDWVKAYESASSAARHVTMSDLVIREHNRKQNQGNASNRSNSRTIKRGVMHHSLTPIIKYIPTLSK